MTRRMFSDDITSSDAFLDMPDSAQNLYFHLGMNADDDGFIGSPKMVMRVIRAGEDDYKLLIVKKFILTFENGICVVKHWRINNYIRKDIYRETKYQKEKSQLFIRENGAYTLNPELSLPVPKGHFTLKDKAEMGTYTPRARNVHIGKVRIGKESKDIMSPIKEVDFEKAWLTYPRKVGKGAARKACSVEAHKKTSQWQDHKYIPHFATFLNQERWEDDVEEETSGQQKEAIIIGKR